MGLLPGAKLGPYEIVAPLGAGGMGEVYRARDTRLQRDVAVKILPAELCRDAERRSRFEREALATSQISHPNILSIFDVGTQDGIPYLVTELLDGETLRDRLNSGGVPIRKAIDFSAQIARGLGAAHEKGIVHRDIKPENIFLCRDGSAKILDLGLARFTEEADGPLNATVTQQTSAGAVLGTAAYLSPEQARGQAVDARSDLFSLGTVTYEMLAGQRPFHGKTFADLVSAILKDDTAPFSPESKVPLALDRIVHRCLEKNPEERFQSARDLAFQLDSLNTGTELRSGVIPSSGTKDMEIPRWHGGLRWLLAGLLLFAATFAAWWTGRHSLRHVVRTIQFQRLTDFYGMEETPTFSPDGKSIAFVADTTGSRQIWVRLLAGGPPLQLTLDAGDHLAPRWAPDSATILYFTPPLAVSTQGTAWEISALGGVPRRLLDTLSEMDVSHDGKSLAFFRLNAGRIELVRAGRDASNPQVLTQLPKQTGGRQPRWSPDDSAIAFVTSERRWSDNLFSVNSSGGPLRQITHDGVLMKGYAWLPNGSGVVYSSSRGSTLLYLPTLHLWRISTREGDAQQLTFGDESDESPDLDSAGRIVASRRRMGFDIWKFPVDSNPTENVRRAVRITHQTGQVQTPSLSPDGHEVVFLSDTGGHGNLWIQTLATGQTRQLTYAKEPGTIYGVPLWSPDGSYIAYARVESNHGIRDIAYWLVRPDGSENHAFLSKGTTVTWSWDARWIYYVNYPDSRTGLSAHLMKLPVAGGDPIEVRKDDATGPALAPDGSTVYYARELEAVNGLWDYELRKARPENGESILLARIPGERVPSWQALHPVISSDGKWLAMPLNDLLGTNVWLFSTDDGKARPLTDFGDRRTFIARRLSWSNDGRWIFAAVGEGDSDVVMFNGLLP
jgi:serine/threonine protein kinase/Tol biopolymer transport system component